MGFIGAVGAIATLVFIIKCGRRAVDGIEDKKCWAYLLASMLAMSIGTSWPDMYTGIGMFFLLAWLAYLANWLYKVIAHKVAKREKAAKKDFWMPIACFALMIVAVAIAPEKEADASSLVTEPVDSSAAVSSSVEEKSDSRAEQEAERNAALKAESERRAAEAAASSKKEESASKKQSESEKAKEEERNAAIKAESAKLAAASSKAASKPKRSNSNSEKTTVVTTIDFDTVYKEYKANEVRAEETYGKKRYRVVGNVNALTDDGLMNLMGGVTVTLTRKVGNTTVFFFASFPKDQKEKIMQINAGDDITIVGEMRNLNFFSCEIESYTRNGKTTTIY